MIIPKEDVISAKEKLGDRNFDLIMDGYLEKGLVSEDDIDRKNMRCRCPHHAGDRNPSFSYDRKMHRMHCFGCQKDVDIQDMRMSLYGETYLEATQKLFEEAGVQYAFTEKKLKTQPKEYIYPTAPSKDNDMTKVYEYWEHRGIPREIIDYADVRADEHGNSAFLTYDQNDTLIVVKLKPTHKIDKASGEAKCFFQKGTSVADGLWNSNRTNTSEPLLITEGAPDALSAMAAGYTNVVSPLKGAGSFGWIQENWDYLEQFSSIIVCSDNDAAGYKMRDEVVYRLGSWRCKICHVPQTTTWSGKEYPCNDLNDLLVTAGKEAVLKAILNATDTPVKSVTDFADVTGIDLDEMDGIETGLKAIDDELYKLYYGTVTLLSGRPGAGKSSIINSILANAMQDRIPCWLFSKEMPLFLTKSWLSLQLAGPRNVEKRLDRKGHVYYSARSDAKKKINEWSRGLLYMYNDGDPNDLDSVMNSMLECTRKFGCKLLIIDNLMCLDLKNPEGELKAQTDLITKLIEFAIKYHVAVILVAHPRKAQVGELRDGDLTLDSISGSSNLGNMAHRSIALRRITDKEHEDSTNKLCNFNVKVTITKDRLLGKADVGFGLFYDVPTRRFFSNYSEYARSYGWDTTEYLDDLPVPLCIQQEEAMRSIDQEADREVFGA